MTDNILGPDYTITYSTQASLDEIERQSWLIEHMLLMPRHHVWVQRDVRIRRASNTTRIEGATLNEREVRDLERSRATGTLNENERANVNALEAYDFIDFVSDQPDIPIDELVIRQLNRYFMTGASQLLTPGAYRNGQNTVGGYTPPDQGDVPALMRAFALWSRSADDIHPVVKAGLAHIHLIAIHPFWDGNGRTARGLSTLMLQRSEFGFRNLLSMERSMFDFREDYFVAIERTLGIRFSDRYDATPWLEFFALVIRLEADALRAVLTEWHRWMEEGHEFMEAAGVPARLADGVAFAKQIGSITRRDYIDITGVSAITASRDLAKLVEIRMLIPEGKTRNRVYYPDPNAFGETDPGQEQLTLPEPR